MSTEQDVRALLGLPDDQKIEIVIEWDSTEFKDSVCDATETDHPAVVHVDWWSINYDPDTDAPRWGGLEQEAFCIDHAREILAEIVEELAPFEWDPFDSLTMPFGAEIGSPMVKVMLSASALVTGLKATA
ncbi:hypothetical protein ACFYY5_29245 [Nocardia elegans]|uniref:Uncharacterized protein n=1 Tax=Nocardia elegans TaxID=300029 RepID=A0ABW6TNM6_9NOCA